MMKLPSFFFFFNFRGQIVAKVAKYPHVGDYRQFVDELDEKEFLSLRLIAAELRNHYVSDCHFYVQMLCSVCRIICPCQAQFSANARKYFLPSLSARTHM